MADRCQLYYITDRKQFPGDDAARRRAVLDKIAGAARAGVDYIQLREKDLSSRDLEQLACQAVHAIMQIENPQRTTRLLINSRADIALAAGADGIHLRANDISPHEVRQVITRTGHGPPTTDYFLIAASCHSRSEVLRAESEQADFAVFAPVFEKKDQPATRPAGLTALREVCRAKIPIFALGGVTL